MQTKPRNKVLEIEKKKKVMVTKGLKSDLSTSAGAKGSKSSSFCSTVGTAPTIVAIS